MQIDGYTRLAAVVATPIKHSISPFIHNYAFEKTGINGVYVAWDIPESELQVTLKISCVMICLALTSPCLTSRQLFLILMK